MTAECSVCCENFISNGIVYSTPCGHIFHDKCIETWIANSMTCPQCRHRTIRTDLRRLYFNVNLNSSRFDLNSTASIVEMLEKERTIATLRQLNQDLISENERVVWERMHAEKKLLERIFKLEQQLNKMRESKEELSANCVTSEREKDKLRNEFKIEKQAMEAQFRGDKEKLLEQFKNEKIKLMRQHKDDLEKVQLNQRSNTDGTALYTAPSYRTRSNATRASALHRAESEDCVVFVGTMPGPASKKPMLKKTTTSSRTVTTVEPTATERARRTVNSLNSAASTATASLIAARKKLPLRDVRKPLANSTNAQKK